VLRQHNVEFQIWDRLAANEKNPVKKWYLRLLAKRLKQFEKNHLNPYDLIVPVTADDGKLFKSLGCTSEIVDAPAGIDTNRWKPSATLDLNQCYHLGSLEWMPNQEAMEWFLKDIWPLIHAQYPAMIFSLAGKNMPEVFKKLNISGVRVESYVEDATAYIADKGINIVPLKSGSGIRLKILEAMSAGKLVISTTIGAQGIHSIDGKHLLIADTPEQFLEKMKWVQENPDKAQDMMHQARILIETEYSNHSVIERLLAHFQRLLAQKK
jgi:glycosyltransferase involved in cell wall biosynthesis